MSDELDAFLASNLAEPEPKSPNEEFYAFLTDGATRLGVIRYRILQVVEEMSWFEHDGVYLKRSTLKGDERVNREQLVRMMLKHYLYDAHPLWFNGETNKPRCDMEPLLDMLMQHERIQECVKGPFLPKNLPNTPRKHSSK